MAINIKNREVEAYLGEIRSATGKGITEIVLDLTRHEAERLRRARDYESDLHAWRKPLDRQPRNPPDAPSADEIIGYDEWGLPT